MAPPIGWLYPGWWSARAPWSAFARLHAALVVEAALVDRAERLDVHRSTDRPRVCRFGKHKGGHSAALVVSRVLRQSFQPAPLARLPARQLKVEGRFAGAEAGGAVYGRYEDRRAARSEVLGAPGAGTVKVVVESESADELGHVAALVGA